MKQPQPNSDNIPWLISVASSKGTTRYTVTRSTETIPVSNKRRVTKFEGLNLGSCAHITNRDSCSPGKAKSTVEAKNKKHKKHNRVTTRVRTLTVCFKDHSVVVCVVFLVPCLRAAGQGVPGFRAGCALCLFFFRSDPDDSFCNFCLDPKRLRYTS